MILNTKYFHVTATANIASIFTAGLRGNRAPRNRPGGPLETASIFVLTVCDERLTDEVAIRKVWVGQDIEEYAIIGIAQDGITGKIITDDGAEQSAKFHRIIEQDVIAPQYLVLVRRRILEYPGRNLAEITQSFLTRHWTEYEWDLARDWLQNADLKAQEEYEAQ